MEKPVAANTDSLSTTTKTGFRLRTVVSGAFDHDHTLSGVTQAPQVKSLDECQNYEDAASFTLSETMKTFEHAMVLLFRGGELRPWKWSSTFTPKSSDIPAVSFEDPSVFRIAFRTCLPYHGYVVSSDENAKFFDQWLGGQLPKHITLVPMMIDGQLCGMLLGITNGEIAYKASLGVMQNHAAELARAFKRLRSAQKAAA
jgi:hypothetical protein